jgi:hypothetical protein
LRRLYANLAETAWKSKKQHSSVLAVLRTLGVGRLNGNEDGNIIALKKNLVRVSAFEFHFFFFASTSSSTRSCLSVQVLLIKAHEARDSNGNIITAKLNVSDEDYNNALRELQSWRSTIEP